MEKKALRSLNIYFIRHAQSENNAVQAKDPENYHKNRVADPKLSDLGILQVKQCALHLKKRKIVPTQILVSPQKRALMTADGIQQIFNKSEVYVKQHICELGYCYLHGDDKQIISFKGDGRSTIQKNYPKFNLDDDIQEEGWNQNEGGETMEEMHERAKNFVDYLKQYVKEILSDKESKETIFVITHGIFFDAIMGYISDRKENSDFKYNKTQNTSINKVQIDSIGGIQLISYNDTQHLEDWCLDPTIKKEAQKYGGLNPKVYSKGMV